jgi:hypothetical protein
MGMHYSAAVASGVTTSIVAPQAQAYLFNIIIVLQFPTKRKKKS